jgi:hypothetical protein
MFRDGRFLSGLFRVLRHFHDLDDQWPDTFSFDNAVWPTFDTLIFHHQNVQVEPWPFLYEEELLFSTTCRGFPSYIFSRLSSRRQPHGALSLLPFELAGSSQNRQTGSGFPTSTTTTVS